MASMIPEIGLEEVLGEIPELKVDQARRRRPRIPHMARDRPVPRRGLLPHSPLRRAQILLRERCQPVVVVRGQSHPVPDRVLGSLLLVAAARSCHDCPDDGAHGPYGHLCPSQTAEDASRA